MATRKMNFKLLRHHINEVCKLIDASDQGMATETSDDGVLNLAGPETEIEGATNDAKPRKSISMREAFGLSMNGPLHQHQPKKP